MQLLLIQKFTSLALAMIILSSGAPADTTAVAKTTNNAQASKVSFTHDGQTVHGLLFGKGKYGVILSHGAIYDAKSWTPLATEIAKNGMVALSLEEVNPDDIIAANAYLREKHGVKEIALIGASAGGSTAISAMSKTLSKWDQIVLLSSVGDVSGLGSVPKFFVSSEDEGMTDAVMRMATQAEGGQNETLTLKGSAHAQAIFRTSNSSKLTSAIVEHLIKRAKLIK